MRGPGSTGAGHQNTARSHRDSMLRTVARRMPVEVEVLMSVDLIVVLVLLAVTIALFAIGRPRMDAVALLVIVALPLISVLTVPETLAGFADPNVVLIAALFVVGEGLSRTGVTFRLGDWLSAQAGTSQTRLIVLLMLSVALLGAVMSSTGVVAIFIPVVLSIAARTGLTPRQLLMPLSMAGLMSGMLTLIATAPNLVVDAELRRAGLDGFDFFSVTPFGIVILLLGIGYVLIARRFLGSSDDASYDSRRTFRSLISDYEVDRRTGRFRVAAGSPLVGSAIADIDLSGIASSVLGLERTRFLRGTTLATRADSLVQRGDTIVLDVAPPAPMLRQLKLAPAKAGDDFFDSYARQVGMAEVIVTPDSAVRGRSVREARFRAEHEVTVLGPHRDGGRCALHSDRDSREHDDHGAGGLPLRGLLETRAPTRGALPGHRGALRAAHLAVLIERRVPVRMITRLKPNGARQPIRRRGPRGRTSRL